MQIFAVAIPMVAVCMQIDAVEHLATAFAH